MGSSSYGLHEDHFERLVIFRHARTAAVRLSAQTVRVQWVYGLRLDLRSRVDLG